MALFLSRSKSFHHSSLIELNGTILKKGRGIETDMVTSLSIFPPFEHCHQRLGICRGREVEDLL